MVSGHILEMSPPSPCADVFVLSMKSFPWEVIWRLLAFLKLLSVYVWSLMELAMLTLDNFWRRDQVLLEVVSFFIYFGLLGTVWCHTFLGT